MVKVFEKYVNYSDSYAYLLAKSITGKSFLTEGFNVDIQGIIQSIFEKLSEFIQKLIYGFKDFLYKIKRTHKEMIYKKRFKEILKNLYQISPKTTVAFPDIDSYRKCMSVYTNEITNLTSVICTVDAYEWGSDSPKTMAIDKLTALRVKYAPLLEQALNTTREISFDKALVELNRYSDDPTLVISEDQMLSIWIDIQSYSNAILKQIYRDNGTGFLKHKIPDENVIAKLIVERMNKLKSEMIQLFTILTKITASFSNYLENLMLKLQEKLYESPYPDTKTRLNVDRGMRKIAKQYVNDELDEYSNDLVNNYALAQLFKTTPLDLYDTPSEVKKKTDNIIKNYM